MEHSVITDLTISSPAFEMGDDIPLKYTCDGKNSSPPLIIEHIPDEAKSMVIIMDDPDAPIRTWDLWVVWDIPPLDFIEEGYIPGTEGLNDFQQHHYCGPAPFKGRHRYRIKVYALDVLLELPGYSRKPEVESAMEGHILARGFIVGYYDREM